MDDITADEVQAINASQKPKKTWFIERGDGFRFAAEEGEAYEIFNNKSNWRRHDFKILGVSDSKLYYSLIKDIKDELEDLSEQIKDTKDNLNKFIKSEDRMRFEDLLDEDDPKLEKVGKLIKDNEAKLGELEGEYKTFMSNGMSVAFDESVEACKGIIENPSNKSIITPNQNDRAKILGGMLK